MSETVPALGWWTISGEDLLDMLRRAQSGESADALYAEAYANSRPRVPGFGHRDGDATVNHALNAILRDLAFLEDCWPELADSRFPGTARPWREPQMTSDRRAELAAEHAREALVVHTDLPRHLRTRAPESLGESPAPGHVDVMDLLVEILAVADETAEHVAQVAGVDRLPAAGSAFADPRPFLRHIAHHVAQAADADFGMFGVVADNLRPLVRGVAQSLSLLRDGQILKAPCFACGGKTPDHPVGGALTLRVTSLDDDTPAVVCRNPLCEPSEQDCGNWIKGSPAWLIHEWEWLSKRLEETAA